MRTEEPTDHGEQSGAHGESDRDLEGEEAIVPRHDALSPQVPQRRKGSYG